jgi:hypothetical protein
MRIDEYNSYQYVLGLFDIDTDSDFITDQTSTDVDCAQEAVAYWCLLTGRGVYSVGWRALLQLSQQLPAPAAEQLRNGTAAGATAHNPEPGRCSSETRPLVIIIISSSRGAPRGATPQHSAVALDQMVGSADAPCGPMPEAVSQQLASSFLDVENSLQAFSAEMGPLVSWATEFCLAVKSLRLQWCSSSNSSSSSDERQEALKTQLIGLVQNSPTPHKSAAAVTAASAVIDGLFSLSSELLAALPPSSLCCSSPSCESMRGASELDLVAGRGLCGGCRAARYCSRACQQQDWSAHRKVCMAGRGA